MSTPDAQPQNRLTRFSSRLGKLFTRRGTLPLPIKAAWADTEIKQDDDDRFGFRDYAAPAPPRAPPLAAACGTSTWNSKAILPATITWRSKQGG
jgi:hypothetical protein